MKKYHVYIADENNSLLTDNKGNYITATIDTGAGFSSVASDGECARGGLTTTINLSTGKTFWIDTYYSSAGLYGEKGRCLSGYGYMTESVLDDPFKEHKYGGLYKFDPRYAEGGFDFIIDDYRFCSGNEIYIYL